MEEKRKRKDEEGKIMYADPNRFVSASYKKPRTLKLNETPENKRNAIMSYQEFLNRNARHTTPVPIYEDSWKEALLKEPDENEAPVIIEQGPVPVYDPSWKEALLRYPDEKGGRKRRTKKHSKKHRKSKKSKRKMSSKKKSRKSKK